MSLSTVQELGSKQGDGGRRLDIPPPRIVEPLGGMVSLLGSCLAGLANLCPPLQWEGQLCHTLPPPPHCYLCLSRLHPASCPLHSPVAMGTLGHVNTREPAAAFAKGLVVCGTGLYLPNGGRDDDL